MAHIMRIMGVVILSALISGIPRVFAQSCATLQTMSGQPWGDSTEHLSFSVTQSAAGLISGNMFGAFGSPCNQSGGAQTNTAGYTVSGVVLGSLGSGQFDIGSTNANGALGPDGKPCMGGDLKLQVSGKGCTTAKVFGTTWPSNPSNPYPWVFTRECPKPTGELRPVFLGWDDSEGYPTIGKWQMTVMPSDYNFGGMSVNEGNSPGEPLTDTCFRSGDPTNFQFGGVTGASWPITAGANTYGPDFIGTHPDVVDYYRQHNRAPCAASVIQKMYVGCDSGFYGYTNPDYALSAGIGAVTVSSQKTVGLLAIRNWGTPAPVISSLDAILILLSLLK